MKLNITLLILILPLLAFTAAYAEEEPAPAPEPENIVLTNYHAAPYGDYDELQADYTSFGRMIIGEVDIDGDNDFDIDDIRAISLGGVAASGVTDIRGGLVIETRTNDPASPKPGQLWLRRDVVPTSSGGSELQFIWGVASNFSSGQDEARSITSDSDYIYITGYDYVDYLFKWRIEKRRKSNGAIVWPAFSDPSNGIDFAQAITSDGSYIYVAGSDAFPGNDQWRIEKRNKSNGEPAWSQAVTSNFSSSYDVAYSITNDDDYIYISGFDKSTGKHQWRIEKRKKSDGAVIWSKMSTGIIANAVVSDDDYIYVTGYDNAFGAFRWRTEKRRKSDGELDWPQAVTSNSSMSIVMANSITLDNDCIYIAGDGGSEWRIEKRRKSDGGLIWSKVSNPSPNTDIAYSIISDNIYIYIAGEYSNQAKRLIEMRKKSDGSLVSSVISIPSSNMLIARSMTSDNDYIYVAGKSYARWHIEKYKKPQSFIDIGLRLRTGTQTITIACEPEGSVTSPLRIARDTKTYGIALVDTTDPSATNIRIKTASGIKALKKL